MHPTLGKMHPAFRNAPDSPKNAPRFFRNAPWKTKNAPELFPWVHFSIKIWVLSHNSTLILIESGYCNFYQKPQYFWAFQRFKADLGSSRDRPFLRLWGFQPIPAKLGFVGFFLGSLILWVGSLDLSLGSLDYWVVRWFLGKFVGFVPGSLILWGVRWIIVFCLRCSRFSSRVLFIGLLLCYNANSEWNGRVKTHGVHSTENRQTVCRRIWKEA